jgi:hypothetical protein
MPTKNAVIWINHPEEIADKIEQALQNKTEFVLKAQQWFEKINQHPIQEASTRILSDIKAILSK